MKNIIIVVSLIIVAAIGYYAYTTYKTSSISLPQEKLDINFICERALAYMTFPDGVSANKFVAECIEGKHPEVIEKYRADMNLFSDTAN